MIIRGRRCKRVDVGHSMRLAAVDISDVPSAQVRRRRAPRAAAGLARPAWAARRPRCERVRRCSSRRALARRFALAKG